MKKTLLATTLLVALTVSTGASHAFTWSDLNPMNWGRSNCGCEKVCKKDNCCHKPKCKKDKCKPKCDPCQKQTCDPCQKQNCDPCQKPKCDPCESMSQTPPCAVPDAPCNACDRLQEATEK